MKLFSSLLLGAIVGFFVWFLGGPPWAVYSMFYIAYLIEWNKHG